MRRVASELSVELPPPREPRGSDGNGRSYPTNMGGFINVVLMGYDTMYMCIYIHTYTYMSFLNIYIFTYCNKYMHTYVRTDRQPARQPQPDMPKKSVMPYTSTNCPHAKSQRRSISAQLKEKREAATRDRIFHDDHIKNANISGRTGAAMPTSR